MSDLAHRIADVTLIDQHVHGCWLTPGDRQRFENALNEANTDPITHPGFDCQLGFAVRAHCGPLLGLPKHVAPEDYWSRRGQLGETELARLFLTAAGVSDWLVDTGVGGGVADTGEMAALSGNRAHEVVRLEEVAEQAAHAPGDYAAAFDEILHRRAAGAQNARHRGGRGEQGRERGGARAERGGERGHPGGGVAQGRGRWRDRGGVRLTDLVLLRFGLHRALRLRKPLQFHVGFGDRDCDLDRANPLLLLDFLRQSGDTPIVLLHCYPYEREAGYLAQAFNNVYVDGGLSVNHLGARSPAFIARLLELAPFGKIVYSSDGYGPAELHFLGAALWRKGIHRVVSGFVADGEWSEDDAVRVVNLIARDNAARIYRV
ncbi:amidohydrolase family protein [Mycobacterium bohemicum]|uniref:amidohydrolase family protein n=1 Tax=Mycobacterium bohemicum TaxID=56425 RepID=UPI002015FB67|nr:amidohydrolase family protein [Mycobacterium bohemicum]